MNIYYICHQEYFLNLPSLLFGLIAVTLHASDKHSLFQLPKMVTKVIKIYILRKKRNKTLLCTYCSILLYIARTKDYNLSVWKEKSPESPAPPNLRSRIPPPPHLNSSEIKISTFRLLSTIEKSPEPLPFKNENLQNPSLPHSSTVPFPDQSSNSLLTG